MRKLTSFRNEDATQSQRTRLRGGQIACLVLLAGLVAACQPAPQAHFNTIPVGGALPSGATCATRVRPAPEVRTGNYTANHTRGRQKNLSVPYSEFGRVDGNFVGTTDEIIQWAACKWGMNEDVVRAQVARESWWDQHSVGDFHSTAANCVPGHPIGADGKAGQCPGSGGLMSLTYQYYKGGFPEAMNSTAYNLDYTLAWWRSCYNGKITWLNDVERGATYRAGDTWGCVGTWYAGRWQTSAAKGYINEVKAYMDKRIWTTPTFKARG